MYGRFWALIVFIIIEKAPYFNIQTLNNFKKASLNKGSTDYVLQIRVI